MNPSELKEVGGKILPFIPVVIVLAIIFLNTNYAGETGLSSIDLQIEADTRHSFNHSAEITQRRFVVVESNKECPEVYRNQSAEKGFVAREGKIETYYTTFSDSFTIENVDDGDKFKMCSATEEGTFYRTEAFETVFRNKTVSLRHEWDKDRNPLTLRITEYNQQGASVSLPTIEIVLNSVSVPENN